MAQFDGQVRQGNRQSAASKQRKHSPPKEMPQKKDQGEADDNMWRRPSWVSEDPKLKNAAGDRNRLQFIQEHDCDPAPLNPATDRRSFFENLRRARAVVQAQQRAFKTTRELEGVKDQILKYIGQPAPIMPTKQEPTILEPWKLTCQQDEQPEQQ